MVERLPNELLLKIFDYLSLDDWTQCEQVCKKWHPLIAHDWLQVKKLATKSPFDETNLAILALRCTNITHLSLRMFLRYDDRLYDDRPLLARLFLKCPHLISIDFGDHSKLDDITLQTLFQNANNLREVSFRNAHNVTGKWLPCAKNLVSIVMDSCYKLAVEHVCDMIKNNASTLVHFQSIGYWLPDDIVSTLIDCGMPKLQVLAVTLVSMQRVDELHRLPCLTTVDFYKSFVSNDEEDTKIAVLLNRSSTMKSLALKRSDFVSDSAFTQLPINAPLESIDIEFCDDLTDASLKCLAQACSNTLRSVNFSYCDGICGSEVLGFVMKLPKIDFIDVRSMKHFEFSSLCSLVTFFAKNVTHRVVIQTGLNEDDEYSEIMDVVGFLLDLMPNNVVKLKNNLEYSIDSALFQLFAGNIVINFILVV